jgi:hypothetical protein
MTNKITRQELIQEINTLMDGLKDFMVKGAETVPDSLLFKGSSVVALEAAIEVFKTEAKALSDSRKKVGGGLPPQFN